MTPESQKRPARWRYLTLLEVSRGKFTVCFPHTRNRVDALLRAAAKLPDRARTDGVSLLTAVAAGDLLEAWLAVQESSRREAKTKGRAEEAANQQLAVEADLLL